MSRDQDLDRSQDATPHKREEARKRGQVARSADAFSFAVLVVALLASYALLTPALHRMSNLLANGLQGTAAVLADPTAAARLMGRGLQEALLVLAPLLFSVAVAAVLTGLLQTRGLVFSSTPIKPDFSRLNPAAGFKKLLSIRVLHETAKSTLKLIALAATAYLAIQALVPTALRLSGSSAPSLLIQLAAASGGLTAKLCAALMAFVLLDFLFVRWEFLRQLRMSKREFDDEHKNREGDPRIRQRQREIRLQFLKAARAVQRVPQAQVVVTNPTHVAIALQYQHGITPAPVVLAKGAGVLAMQIRRAANKAGVPIVHSPRLARALYKEVPQDGYVPEHWYPPIARILVWLRSLAEARNLREAA